MQALIAHKKEQSALCTIPWSEKAISDPAALDPAAIAIQKWVKPRRLTMPLSSHILASVFAWPGLGMLAFESLFARDLNLLLGIFLLSSVLVVAVNLIVDVIYCFLDPRIEVN